MMNSSPLPLRLFKKMCFDDGADKIERRPLIGGEKKNKLVRASFHSCSSDGTKTTVMDRLETLELQVQDKLRLVKQLSEQYCADHQSQQQTIDEQQARILSLKQEMQERHEAYVAQITALEEQLATGKEKNNQEEQPRPQEEEEEEQVAPMAEEPLEPIEQQEVQPSPEEMMVEQTSSEDSLAIIQKVQQHQPRMGQQAIRALEMRLTQGQLQNLHLSILCDAMLASHQRQEKAVVPKSVHCLDIPMGIGTEEECEDDEEDYEDEDVHQHYDTDEGDDDEDVDYHSETDGDEDVHSDADGDSTSSNPQWTRIIRPNTAIPDVHGRRKAFREQGARICKKALQSEQMC